VKERTKQSAAIDCNIHPFLAQQSRQLNIRGKFGLCLTLTSNHPIIQLCDPSANGLSKLRFDLQYNLKVLRKVLNNFRRVFLLITH